MKNEILSQIISGIDEKYVAEASASAADGGEIRPAVRKRRAGWIAAAACLIIAAALGTGVYAIAAETKEYREAVAFFEENGLSSDGLSRSELKAVYRDITAKNFTYGKTAEVIMNSVQGYEIDQRNPTPEELAVIWDRSIILGRPPVDPGVSQSGYDYRVDYSYVLSEKLGWNVLEKSTLICYLDGREIWEAELPDFDVKGYFRTDEGTFAWGYGSDVVGDGLVALVGGSGNVLWQVRLDNGFSRDEIFTALSVGDGSFAVISRGDNRYLCLTRIDREGKKIGFSKNEVGNHYVKCAARLGSGYLVALSDNLNYVTSATSRIYRLDADGNVIDSFTYETADTDYNITDMAEFEGRIYLSAYAVRKEDVKYGREIGALVEYLLNNKKVRITSEELTPLVRANYTALLLICDTQDGTPESFYSVDGSLGGKLSVSEEGLLEWDVQSVTSTYYSPASSAYSIGGECRVFRYAFDASGDLKSQTDTGETTEYRR